MAFFSHTCTHRFTVVTAIVHELQILNSVKATGTQVDDMIKHHLFPRCTVINRLKVSFHEKAIFIRALDLGYDLKIYHGMNDNSYEITHTCRCGYDTVDLTVKVLLAGHTTF